MNKLFLFTIILKGIDGCIDLFAGLFLFFFPSSIPDTFIPYLINREITEPPHQINQFLITFSQNTPPEVWSFLAFYLTLHGLIKIGLVFAFTRKDYATYKVAEGVLMLFIGYQLYRFLYTHSIILLILIGIDILILFLAQRESKKLRKITPPRE